MFGLTEITGQLDEATKLAIIPTVVLPFTILGMILTSVATWIAALFGVKLKAEGPKRLFEVLMKPKVLILSLLLNLVFFGVYRGGQYLLNGPYPLWWIEFQNSKPLGSEKSYEKVESSFTKFDLDKNIPKVAALNGLSVVWETQLKGLVFGPPIISESSLFTGDQGGRLIELNAENGEVIRKFEIGKPVMASPVILNQKIYVGEGEHFTHNARLYAFDLKTGTFNNAFETEGHIERGVVVAQDGKRKLLITPAGKDGLYAIDAETMEKVWQAPIGHVDALPNADEERVYVGSGLEQGFAETPTKLFALDLHTGTILWQKNMPTSVWAMPTLWKEIVCFGIGDVYHETHYGQLACYNRKTGSEYFAYNTDGALISQSTVIGDHLIIADFHGTIYQFNLQTKSLDWSIVVPSKGFNYAAVVVDNKDRLILPGKDGLYVYSRNDQSHLLTWKPSEPWKGTYTNVTFYKDLWILIEATGKTMALRPQE